jgi:hypothetical protein
MYRRGFGASVWDYTFPSTVKTAKIRTLQKLLPVN